MSDWLGEQVSQVDMQILTASKLVASHVRATAAQAAVMSLGRMPRPTVHNTESVAATVRGSSADEPRLAVHATRARGRVLECTETDVAASE